MKKCLLLLLTLLLLSGCAVTRMDNKSYEEVMDKIKEKKETKEKTSLREKLKKKFHF